MINTIAERKLIELDQKLHSLDNEFDHWLRQSEANGPYEKHHTQIRAVKKQLGGLHAKIRRELTDVMQAGTEEVFSTARNMEMIILAEHRIWDFFRRKYIQRKEEVFADYLKVADELAWACYKPIQSAVYPDPAAPQRKEPPLVFFNGGSSPFSVSRERAYQPEVVPNEPLDDPFFKRIINSLPIPLIGVPWFQMQHLPDALVIGHEVGHTIEDDFKLTGRLEELIKGALDKGEEHPHYRAWKSWLGEMFADFYGCLCLGPAFVGALMDFLLAGKDLIMRVALNEGAWGEYPTEYLRILFTLKVLDEMGFGEDSRRLEKEWRGIYPEHLMEEFEGDIEQIARAFFYGRHESLGATLPEKFRFTVDDQREVETTLLQMKDYEQITSENIRVLFAAVRTAYERTPNEYIANDYSGRLLEKLQGLIKPEVRADEELLSEEQKLQKDANNEAASQPLFQEMLQRVEQLNQRVVAPPEPA